MFETSVYKNRRARLKEKVKKWFGVDPGKWGGPG